MGSCQLKKYPNSTSGLSGCAGATTCQGVCSLNLLPARKSTAWLAFELTRTNTRSPTCGCCCCCCVLLAVRPGLCVCCCCCCCCAGSGQCVTVQLHFTRCASYALLCTSNSTAPAQPHQGPSTTDTDGQSPGPNTLVLGGLPHFEIRLHGFSSVTAVSDMWDADVISTAAQLHHQHEQDQQCAPRTCSSDNTKWTAPWPVSRSQTHLCPGQGSRPACPAASYARPAAAATP
jgi:hypothetical protein